MARRRHRSSVNRIEEKIKKCQKCQNPCNSALNPVFQRYGRGPVLESRNYGLEFWQRGRKLTEAAIQKDAPKAQ
jgi:hypothetical protein